MNAPSRTITRFNDLATRAAAHPAMQAAIVQTVQAHLPMVIEDVLRDLYGGGKVCFYVSKGRSTRKDRRHRVEQLLAAGMDIKAIAATCHCSERSVWRIKNALDAAVKPATDKLGDEVVSDP